MNLAFLGDALDHWKGALFKSLSDTAALRDLRVDLMASDGDAWRAEDRAIFANLIGVQTGQLISHSVGLDERERYFGEIDHTGDLFLDPDTGVATGRVSKPERYIFPSEVNQLLDASPARILVVYQHVRAQKVRIRVDSVLDGLGEASGRFFWVVYESGTVAMLFLSRTKNRSDAVSAHFHAMLGAHGKKRIREGAAT